MPGFLGSETPESGIHKGLKAGVITVSAARADFGRATALRARAAASPTPGIAEAQTSREREDAKWR